MQPELQSIISGRRRQQRIRERSPLSQALWRSPSRPLLLPLPLSSLPHRVPGRPAERRAEAENGPAICWPSEITFPWADKASALVQASRAEIRKDQRGGRGAGAGTPSSGQQELKLEGQKMFSPVCVLACCCCCIFAVVVVVAASASAAAVATDRCARSKVRARSTRAREKTPATTTTRFDARASPNVRARETNAHSHCSLQQQRYRRL